VSAISAGTASLVPSRSRISRRLYCRPRSTSMNASSPLPTQGRVKADYLGSIRPSPARVRAGMTTNALVYAKKLSHTIFASFHFHGNHYSFPCKLQEEYLRESSRSGNDGFFIVSAKLWDSICFAQTLGFDLFRADFGIRSASCRL